MDFLFKGLRHSRLMSFPKCWNLKNILCLRLKNWFIRIWRKVLVLLLILWPFWEHYTSHWIINTFLENDILYKMHMSLLSFNNSVHSGQNAINFIKKAVLLHFGLFFLLYISIGGLLQISPKMPRSIYVKKNLVRWLSFFASGPWVLTCTSFSFWSLPLCHSEKNPLNKLQYLVLLWLILAMEVIISYLLPADQREEGNLCSKKEHFGISQHEML